MPPEIESPYMHQIRRERRISCVAFRAGLVVGVFLALLALAVLGQITL